MEELPRQKIMSVSTELEVLLPKLVHSDLLSLKREECALKSGLTLNLITRALSSKELYSENSTLEMTPVT